jgi:hypothetical protein
LEFLSERYRCHGICFIRGPADDMGGRWGWLAILYSLVVICIPRIYLGYHYPSDIVAGALIGFLIARIMGRNEIRTSLSSRFLVWSQCYPGAFYCAFFLLTCEVAAVFENTRQIVVAAWKLSRNLF